MKIILYKDVPNLGEEGDVKTVADGYARNYLIPKKFAVRYTKSTEIELAQKQQAIARRKEEKSKSAADMKTRIEGLKMELALAAGDKGKLFGSVTTGAVADFLSSEGLQIERKKIELPQGGVKTVGSHRIKVKLYGGEEAELDLEVAASGEKPVIEEAPEEVRVDSIGDDEEEEIDEAYAELTAGMKDPEGDDSGASEETVSEEPAAPEADVSEEDEEAPAEEEG
jgi:large subunit ribosomal protein L9